MPTLERGLAEEKADLQCNPAAKAFRYWKLLWKLAYDRNVAGKLPVDAVIEQIAPISLHRRVKFLANYIRPNSHPGKRESINTTPQNGHWLKWQLTICTAVRWCQSGTLTSTNSNHQWKLQMFSVTKPFYSVAMDILRLLPKEIDGPGRNRAPAFTDIWRDEF